MRAWLLAAVGVLCGGSLSAQTQSAQTQRVIVVDAGPGPVGRYLKAALADPRTRVMRGDTITLARDSTYPSTIVALAQQVVVRGQVQGNVIVVGGDLVIKPIAKIDGKAIAIGGGVYRSMLATVNGDIESNRDFTFDATDVGGVTELRYRPLIIVSERPDFFLPFPFGLRVPSYDRSNGLSVAAGPLLTLLDGALLVDATATYRSQLGRIDPLIAATVQPGRKYWLTASGGRQTKTNDAWISKDLPNSVNALIVGKDRRNYYRAVFGEGFLNRRFELSTLTTSVRAGGRFERASAVRPAATPTSGPWSLFNRTDIADGMFRSNPQIIGGDITSAVAGSTVRWLVQDIKAELDLDVEAPVAITNGDDFVQFTVDGQISFPTFLDHSFRFDAHAIATAGDAPMQRWGYLGGSGTLSTTEPLLGFGGDQLLFLESRYIIPVNQVILPLVGSPTVSFRHLLGSAGVGKLPPLVQIFGVRVAISLFRVDLLMDTSNRKTEVHATFATTR